MRAGWLASGSSWNTLHSTHLFQKTMPHACLPLGRRWPQTVEERALGIHTGFCMRSLWGTGDEEVGENQGAGFPPSPGAHSCYILDCPPSWGKAKSNQSHYLLRDAMQHPVCHVSLIELHHVRTHLLKRTQNRKTQVRRKVSLSFSSSSCPNERDMKELQSQIYLD